MFSDVVITPMITRNIHKAYDEIHSLGVFHGDVRSANILVRSDESVVIIDFEASILNADCSLIEEENQKVQLLLMAAKYKHVF
jgi:serine/threonine protein kinase